MASRTTDYKLLTLAASAARTASATGTAYDLGAAWRRISVLLNITSSATDAADTLDVYVDMSTDNNTWVNVIHFSQQAGDGAAATEYATLEPSTPGASVITATANVAAGAVRPAFLGRYIRARWVIVDSGDADQSHTFSVTAFAVPDFPG